jgi:hypothetical protein
MNRKCQAGLAVAIALGFLTVAPSAVRAQRTGMPPASSPRPALVPASSAVPAHRVPSGSADPAQTSTSVSARSTSVGGHRRTNPRRADAGLSSSAALQNLLNITPNSGFDYEFVNSINSDLAAKALIDPVTQLEIAQAARLLKATGGGLSGTYILGGGGYYVPPESGPESGDQPPAAEDPDAQQAPAPQPQIIIVQQSPQQNAEGGGDAEDPAAPVPDEGQFTLVLHSGKQIQAVAFTHTNDKIVYITPDGGRASIASGDLDADATVRVNEERGTFLQLPL